MIDESLNPFITAYRETLEPAYEAQMKALEQQRKNDYASIMSNANVKGAMFSNFPMRDKIKYDTKTYYPSMIKYRQSYQTALDKLRENTANLINQTKSINEAISDLNKA